MGTQVEVPVEHLQALRPQINKIAKGGLNWCIQPRGGEMTVNVTDGAQGMVFGVFGDAFTARFGYGGISSGSNCCGGPQARTA